MRNGIFSIATFLPLSLPVMLAHAQGDPVEGKSQFAQCTACHTIEAGAASPVGPNLHGVFGRKAGSTAGFVYSDAMKASGIVWDEAKLDAYITKPSAFIPGNKMAFIGLAKANVRANIIAYMQAATK